MVRRSGDGHVAKAGLRGNVSTPKAPETGRLCSDQRGLGPITDH